MSGKVKIVSFPQKTLGSFVRPIDIYPFLIQHASSIFFSLEKNILAFCLRDIKYWI